MKRPEGMTREELEEEVAWRRAEMGEGVLAREIEAVREVFGLTPQQSHAVLIMYRAKERPLTRTALLEQLPARHDRSEDSAGEQIKVIVCNIRKRMGSAAVITSGDGHYRYRLSPEARTRVAAALCTIPDDQRKAA